MRARLALTSSGIELEHREIILRNKPESMLAASPKGTVPVLIVAENRVIDESLDIMLWALSINDPQGWLPANTEAVTKIRSLIQENDSVFKPNLDRYKYAGRYPEHPQDYYRSQGEVFLQTLETRLTEQRFLMGDSMTLADAAIAPFIRQFAHVDREWFFSSSYEHLKNWLTRFLESELFLDIMKKHPLWTDEN
jgi:glutathione S-transferase